MLCCSNYKAHMRLNRWLSGSILVRALPLIPTQGLTLEDVPMLVERCHTQMQTCIILCAVEFDRFC